MQNRVVARTTGALFIGGLVGTACMSESGEPVDALGHGGECPLEHVVLPTEMLERFEGQYQTDYTTEFSTVDCPSPVGRLWIDITFSESEAELLEKRCGADWYVVDVWFRGEPNIDQQRTGYLSEHGYVELEGSESPQFLRFSGGQGEISFGPGPGPAPTGIFSIPSSCAGGAEGSGDR